MHDYTGFPPFVIRVGGSSSVGNSCIRDIEAIKDVGALEDIGAVVLEALKLEHSA